MYKFLLCLSFAFISFNSLSQEINKISGLYHSPAPRETEGNYYFFEKNQFFVFWRYDKETSLNKFAATFKYKLISDKIYACNRGYTCDTDDQFKLRYTIISNKIYKNGLSNRNEQRIILNAEHLDEPMILVRNLD